MERDIVGEPQTGPEAYYFGQLARGVFEIQKCTDCAKHQFFPRVLCVHCGSDALQWVQPSGRGTIYSYSVVRRKPEAGGDYNVVLVDLEEGVRLMSRVEDINVEELRIGMSVQARVLQHEDSGKLVFDVMEAANA